MYIFGCNDEGVLGRNILEEGLEIFFSKVDFLGWGIKLLVGDSYIVVLIDEGKVFVWGNFRVIIK